jgi:hypothetical protein
MTIHPDLIAPWHDPDPKTALAQNVQRFCAGAQSDETRQVVRSMLRSEAQLSPSRFVVIEA